MMCFTPKSPDWPRSRGEVSTGLVLAISCVVLTSCRPTESVAPAPTGAVFDPTRACRLADSLEAVGSRAAGSPGAEAARALLAGALGAAGAREVEGIPVAHHPGWVHLRAGLPLARMALAAPNRRDIMVPGGQSVCYPE